jgi:hypothetical protein
MEGKRSEDRRHAVVGVSCNSARRIEGQQNIRAKFPNALREVGNHPLRFQAVKLAVRVIQNDCAGDL